MMTVTLHRDSPFAPIFPDGAPVTTLVPGEVMLPHGHERCYLLDVEHCEPMQLTAVAEKIAENFGARVADVWEELLVNGMPIRESQCVCGPSVELRFII